MQALACIVAVICGCTAGAFTSTCRSHMHKPVRTGLANVNIMDSRFHDYNLLSCQTEGAGGESVIFVVVVVVVSSRSQ